MHWGRHYLLMLLVAAVIGINFAAGHEAEILAAAEQDLQTNAAPTATLEEALEENSKDRYVRQSVDKEVPAEAENSDKAENVEAEEFEEPELGQSLMSMLGQGMAPGYGLPFAAFGRSPALAFNSLLPALTSFLALPPTWPAALLGAPAPTSPNDLLPASSKVVLMLSEDQQNKVKRSPILSKDLLRHLRQVRQNQDVFPALPSAQDLLAQYNQFLEQASPAMHQTQDLLHQAFSPNIDQFLAQIAPMPILQQMLGQSRNDALEQETPRANIRPASSSSSSASAAPAVAQSNPFDFLQQALSQVNSMTNSMGLRPLLQQGGFDAAASEISEVRVKPEFVAKQNEMDETKLKEQLEKILNDKQRPILWFRTNANKNAEEIAQNKKTPEELFLENKLLAFEHQVIKELRLLQEIVRQAALMRGSDKSGKESNFKLVYPLSQKPLHKITREDIEKALADEYVFKVLQKKFLNYAKDQSKLLSKDSTSMPNKRQSTQHDAMQQLSKDEAEQIMAYMFRNVAGTKENPQVQFEKVGKNPMEQGPMLAQQNSETQMYRGVIQNMQNPLRQGPMLAQQKTEPKIYQGLMEIAQNPLRQGPMLAQQKTEPQMHQGPMLSQQKQETQMHQGLMENTQNPIRQGPMLAQQNTEPQMYQGLMENTQNPIWQGPMLAQQMPETQMYQGLMEPGQLESIDQMQRYWMQQKQQQEQNESKNEPTELMETNDQERGFKFPKKIVVKTKKVFNIPPPPPPRPVYTSHYSYAHAPVYASDYSHGYASPRPSYGYGYRTQDAEQQMQQPQDFTQMQRQQHQQHMEEQQQFAADNMKFQNQQWQFMQEQQIRAQQQNDEQERSFKKGFSTKIKQRPAAPAKIDYGYASPNYQHYASSKPTNNHGGYASYNYRTAVGNDEIESMLREHQTFKKLNDDEKQEPQQHDDKQQNKFTTNSSRNTSSNSTPAITTDEETVGAIFDYLPETLIPFMGLQSVERDDDPWLFKNYNLHHPIAKQDGSYAAYLRSARIKRHIRPLNLGLNILHKFKKPSIKIIRNNYHVTKLHQLKK